MNDKRLNKKLEQAQLGVLFRTPFFGPGVAKLPSVIIGDDEARMIFGEPKMDPLNGLRWSGSCGIRSLCSNARSSN